MIHSNKSIPTFVKLGKIINWEPILTKFKEWVDNYTPKNKNLELVTIRENNEQLLKLEIPSYEFEPEFVVSANNGIPEIVVEPNEKQPILGSIN